MSVKETDDQRERGNERGMEDEDRTGRKERGRRRESVLKCVGEREKSERLRGGRKNRKERDGKESKRRMREKNEGF